LRLTSKTSPFRRHDEKFGQEIIRATAGKKIHGTARSGGINKNLSTAERDEFLKGLTSQHRQDDRVAKARCPVQDYHAKTRRSSTVSPISRPAT
jgi:coenzyme F420-reducing hydrogenase alpha subunit